jgi:UDP-glucose 4,6-dehydratase
MDDCENERTITFAANAILPQKVARICMATKTPWGHVSSGSIYTGARFYDDGQIRVVTNLNAPEMRRIFKVQPERFFGFTEYDEPNYTFRRPPCSFYGGTKALAEEMLREYSQCYIWRPGLPFGEKDEPSNLISKLRCAKILNDHVTSISHVDDFAQACIDLWERCAPFGIYNVSNPGRVSTRQIVEMMQHALKLDLHPEFWVTDTEFHGDPGCLLDVSKLLSTGVRIRPVKEALNSTLSAWRQAPKSTKNSAPKEMPMANLAYRRLLAGDYHEKHIR